jgi:phosphatidylserine/phosphatidylglycerophosphate/cardiolipin synthase-like enzyme
MTKFKYLLFAFALIPAALSAQIVSIATARATQPGSTVTVRGVATSGEELGRIRYFQDGTAGIAAFPGTGSVAGFDTSVKPGDSIEVRGVLTEFNGLLQISPVEAFKVVSSGNALPKPKTIGLPQISEALESQLVRVECAVFGNAGGVFSSSGTYDLSDAGGAKAKVFFRSNHPMLGSPAPGGPIVFTGIVSQFGVYQLLPRTTADFTAAPCFYFTEKLDQSDIKTTGFTVKWRTNLAATSKIKIGTSDTPDLTFNASGTGPDFSYTFTDLLPGVVYWVETESKLNNETLRSGPVPFATKSLSSGQIKVYFTRSIDLAAAGGQVPAGQTSAAVMEETIARINAAQKTIDACLYNNGRTDITNALKAAHQRGVRVRYIASAETSSTALQPPPAFPVVYGNNFALMHNKFMAIDAEITDKCWVMSGSLNWTNGNINDDFNNTLFIQDQSLARTYVLEFEEMWGTGGAQPDLAKGRFGNAKTNNTPHRFLIGNQAVESWFSPSDEVTNRIIQAVQSADFEVLFATLSFTKDEIGQALVDKRKAGISVRGMIENTGDQGTEFGFLLTQGVPVRQHLAKGDLHHKYAVIDAGKTASDPTVVTGSHNWSQSAENSNDENTLVLHSANIALLYKGEFERRWAEISTPTADVRLPDVELSPNPAASVLTIQMPDVSGGRRLVSVRDALGKEHLQAVLSPGSRTDLDVAALPVGHYFVVIQTPHGFASLPFQKI